MRYITGIVHHASRISSIFAASIPLCHSARLLFWLFQAFREFYTHRSGQELYRYVERELIVKRGSGRTRTQIGEWGKSSQQWKKIGIEISCRNEGRSCARMKWENYLETRRARQLTPILLHVLQGYKRTEEKKRENTLSQRSKLKKTSSLMGLEEVYLFSSTRQSPWNLSSTIIDPPLYPSIYIYTELFDSLHKPHRVPTLLETFCHFRWLFFNEHISHVEIGTQRWPYCFKNELWAANTYLYLPTRTRSINLIFINKS